MRKIMAVVLVILIAAGAWWYFSPIWTLQSMRNAAKDHDTARLSEHVDYPALRENLKASLPRYVASQAAKISDNAAGKFGAVIAGAVLRPVIEATISPEGVEAMFAAESSTRGRLSEHVPVTAGDHPVISRDGLSSFRVHGEDPSRGALVFHLEGLRWKLVGIDLPQP